MTKLQRLRRKVVDARRAPRCVPRHPGPLLDFIPELSPELLAPTWLAKIAGAIEEIPGRGPDDPLELCISVPPRHGKTTLLLHAIVWLLLIDPTMTILYASYAHGFAAKQAGKARELAVRAGIVLGDDMQRADEWTTSEGGGVKAVGFAGQLAGEGFRLIIVDDPHKSRAEAESRIVRERVATGFNDDIYTRQDPRGTSVLVVHTRWHVEDLISRLVAETDEEGDAVEPFEYINIPAILETGAALAPELFTAARLARFRSRRGEYSWWSLFMGQPQPPGGRCFIDAVLLPKLGDGAESGDAYRYAIGVDLARTARTRSDYQVAVVMRMNLRTLDVDVVDVERMQGALVDGVRSGKVRDRGFVAKLHALQRRYPGARTVMYTGFDEQTFLALLAAHEKYPCRVDGTPAPGDKFRRAQPYSSAWREGRIRVLQRAPWTSRFIEEHCNFTGAKGGIDDQVDAAAAAYDALMDPAPRPPKTAGRGTGRGSRARSLAAYLCPLRAMASATRAPRERRVHGTHRHRPRRPQAHAHRCAVTAAWTGWPWPAGWAADGGPEGVLRPLPA